MPPSITFRFLVVLLACANFFAGYMIEVIIMLPSPLHICQTSCYLPSYPQCCVAQTYVMDTRTVSKLQENLCSSKKRRKKQQQKQPEVTRDLRSLEEQLDSSTSPLHFIDIESEHWWPDVTMSRGATLADLMRQESELSMPDDVTDATARKSRTLSTSSSASYVSRCTDMPDDVTPLVTNEIVLGLDDVAVDTRNGDVTQPEREVTAL